MAAKRPKAAFCQIQAALAYTSGKKSRKPRKCSKEHFLAGEPETWNFTAGEKAI